MTQSIYIFCSEPHDAYKCNMSPQNKVKLLKNANCCFNCFKLIQISKNCHINKLPCCEYKGLDHHRSVCLRGNKGLNNIKVREF